MPRAEFFKIPLAFAALLLLEAPLMRAGDFPEIGQLDSSRDALFRQYTDDVDESRRKVYGTNWAGETSPDALAEGLRLYSYQLKNDDDLYAVAARCNIPYSSLATLNRISHPSRLPKALLLPTVPGIFVAENPKGDLERLLAASRDAGGMPVITVADERFAFLPGEDFSKTERTFFLNTGFRYPLRDYRITSPFGSRPSPFTGRLQNHPGLDLAAPLGTDVYAALEGAVAETGEDAVYGNYIIVSHEDNWVSLYGHLSAIKASRGQRVGKNTVIGKVGSTGQSTGPHLHFEIRKNGRALDPGKLLFKTGN